MRIFPKPKLSAQLITTRSEFDGLASEWDNLLQGSASNSIFLTFEWLSTWLDTVYPQAELFVVVVRDQEKTLVGAAPFYLAEFKFIKLIGYRYLRFVGDCHSGAEYPDIIIRAGFEESCLASMCEMISGNRMWDCVWLPNMAGWTGSHKRFSQCFGEALSFSRSRVASFSSLPLPTSFEAYLAGLSKSRRTLFLRQEKSLLKNHVITFEFCDRPEEVGEYLDQLFRLHGRRWQSQGQKGSFVRRPLMADFYRRFAPLALPNHWLGLFRLKIDGVIQAVQYGYLYNGAFHQLQEGFAPELPGVGNILRLRVMEWCIAKGITDYDFLGEHTPHKEHWGSRERSGSHLFLGSSRRSRNTLLALREIWPTGRLIDQGVPANHGSNHKKSCRI